MKLWQTLKVVWANIAGNRMRSFLTMLGMIIGVASVIILVSLIQSFSDSIISSYSDMGINNVNVTIKGRNGNMVVTESDMYEYAKKHSDTLKGVTPNVPIQAVVSKKSLKEEYCDIQGIDENFIKTLKKKLQDGHSFTYSNIAIKQKVCIIGSYLNQRLFMGAAQLGDTLRINGEEFTIIGILKEVSNSSQWSGDNKIYLPYTTAIRLLGMGSINSYSFFVKTSEQVTPATTSIENYLFKTFHDNKSYKVTNMMEMLKASQEQINILTSVIGGIAGISLLVAGIGIMNIMLVSVSERTREIGIRKALGAKYRDTMHQFILEAAATSSIGGLLGILLGSFITIQAGKLIHLKASPDLHTVLVSFGVSFGIGVLFGYLPARKAAKLNPIDALRNE